jgi:hypothetical protein
MQALSDITANGHNSNRSAFLPSGAGGDPNMFVQNTAPVGASSTYLWVQTGQGSSGKDFTFWIEDGIA